MRFDASYVCGMIATVNFRLLYLNFRRAALAGLAGLAFAGAARAEGARDIEIVPFHNTSLDTNFDQPGQDDAPGSKVWSPTAPRSLRPSPQQRPTPLPQSQPTVSQEEQQLLDRRRNWVFMTPEDYAATDPRTGKSLFGADKDKNENMTAMERYYHRLEQSARPATNDFSGSNPDRSTAATNYFDNAVRNTDSGLFGETPFNSRPETGIFQAITAGNSANVFGGNGSIPAQTPEESRLQTEQKAHMESFKQLWNIDQADSAATPVAAQPSGLIDSAPLFGASTPGLPTPFKPNLPTAADYSPGASKSIIPAPQPVVTPRYTAPQHSDFTPVQRPF
jgi:hypothetical protein